MIYPLPITFPSGVTPPLIILDHFKVTFNGVDKTAFVKLGSVSYTLKENERSTAQMTLLPGFLPSKYDAVVIYDVDGLAILWTGVVTNRSLVSYEQGSFNSEANIQCTDAIIFADWTYWYKVYSTNVSLKQVMADLIIEKLSAYSITLDPLQDDGDLFAPFTVGTNGLGQRASDVLRDLASRCVPPRVVQMGPQNVLRILVPGTRPAPFNVTDAAPRMLNVDWTDSDFTPANKVTLVCGPTGTGTPTQTWVTSAATSYEVDIQCLPGGWRDGFVIEGGITRTVSPPNQEGYYYWDDTAGKGSIVLGLGVLPPAGTVLTFTYTAIYPFVVTASSGASPIIEAQYTDEKQLLLGPAQLEVNGFLSQLNQAPREITATTLERGFLPNQSITFTLSNKSLSAATFHVTQVQADLTEFIDTVTEPTNPKRMFLYTLMLSETTVYQGSYLDQARELFGGGGSGASGVASLDSVQSGQQDVIAHRDGAATGNYESQMTVYTNSGGEGATLRLGRMDQPYAWDIIADALKGATPGTIACLKIHHHQIGSTVECILKLQADGTGNYVLKPGAGMTALGGVYIGDPLGLLVGEAPFDAAIRGILTDGLWVNDGIHERGRADAIGELIDVGYFSGNYTASGSMTWGVMSGDAKTFQYMYIGTTCWVNFWVESASIGGTVDSYLYVPLPESGFGRRATAWTSVPCRLRQNGVEYAAQAFIGPGDDHITMGLYGGGNLQLSTDATIVQFQMLIKTT